eukprot:GHVS01012220.1.p1 GENE.GHVS01012220.1~~GHVS01012220.1.p1  ORF type:complete len:1017 (-),score=239.77 GHVS01012220.1:174-3014(-)
MPVAVVMSSLPWFSRRNFEDHRDKICSYITFAAQYMQTRKCPWKKAVEVLRSPGEETSPDRLDTLVEAVTVMMQSNWQSKATFRFYQQTQLAMALEPPPGVSQHVMLTLPLPRVDGNDFVLNYRPVASSLRLPVTTDAVAQPLAHHDRWLIEDHVICIMQTFQDNIELCATMLVKIPVPDEQFEYILIETILSEMLLLPKICDAYKASDCNVFYFVLLQKLVKQQMPKYQEIVRKAVNSMVNRIVDFDDEAFEILSEFLGYWLSATNCEWQFGNWLSVAKPAAPLIRFVRRSMENLVTLAWREFVLSHVPEYVHEYIPAVGSPSCPWLAKQNDQDEGEERKVPIEFAAMRQLMKFNLDHSQAYRHCQQSRIACFVIHSLHRRPLSHLPIKYMSDADHNTGCCCATTAMTTTALECSQQPPPPPWMVKNELNDEEGGGGCSKRHRSDAVVGDINVVMKVVGGDDAMVGEDEKVVAGSAAAAGTTGEEGEGMVVDYADDDEDYHQKHSSNTTTTNNNKKPPTSSQTNPAPPPGSSPHTTAQQQQSVTTTSSSQPNNHIVGHQVVVVDGAAESSDGFVDVDENSFVEFQHEEIPAERWTHKDVVQLFLKALLCQGIKSDTHMIRLVENYGFILVLLRPTYLRNPSFNAFGRYDINSSWVNLRCPAVLSQADEEEDTTTTTIVAATTTEDDEQLGSDRAFYEEIVTTIYQFWDNSPQKICLCLNRLLISGVVPYDCIVHYSLFAVQDDLLDELREWYIIRMVLREVVESESSAEFTLRAHKRLHIKTEEQMERLTDKATRSQCRVHQMVHFLLVSLVKKIASVPTDKVLLRKHLLLRLLAYGRKFSAYVDVDELTTSDLSADISSPVKAAIDLIAETQRYYKTPGAATTAARDIDPSTLVVQPNNNDNNNNDNNKNDNNNNNNDDNNNDNNDNNNPTTAIVEEAPTISTM